MGWNDIRLVRRASLFDGLEADSRFYFLHSYHFECDAEENVLAVCDYGLRFSCAVNSANVFGVQFHPEKSHRFGVQLLKNFAEM
jgi:glutamine amidotransferase